MLEKYDCLDLSTPTVWEKKENPYFCKTEGWKGQLEYENGELIDVFLSINPYKFFESTSDPNLNITDFLGDDLNNLLKDL